MLLIVFSIAAGVAVQYIQRSIYESRKIRTIRQIQNIHRAIFGDTRLRDNNDYGYVGDLGELPRVLDDLLSAPGGGGAALWDGPYITNEFLEDNSDPFVDAWGNDIEYDNDTGDLWISTDSVGDDPVFIPLDYTDPSGILYGGIEGSIIDELGLPMPKGHRRFVEIQMVPIFEEPWPDIPENLEMDKELYHMHKVWSLHNTIREGIDKFCDPIDVDRKHWQDKGSDYWRWLPDGVAYDIGDDTYDDHETEYDTLGVQRRFDPHFADYWSDYSYDAANKAIYEEIQIFIHPDRYGEYICEEIPVRPYILTCYHDLYEISLKQYVMIQPNVNKLVSFRFPVTFAQPDTSGGGTPPPGGDESSYLSMTGDYYIDGTEDYGLFLSNSSVAGITIINMKVVYTKSGGNPKLNEIGIDSVIRWTGSVASNKDAYITNTTITAGATNVPLYFKFSANLSGESITSITFDMSDASSVTITNPVGQIPE
ncbi:hypothetical protein ACFL67_03820 [candidate division KSB1 bacterium]